MRKNKQLDATKRTKPKSVSALIQLYPLVLCVLLSGHAQSEDDAVAFMPPTVKLVDRNQVNVVSQQLAISLTDLAIGHGDLSLTHSISAFGLAMLGYNDVFHGHVHKGFLRRGPGDGTAGDPIMTVVMGEQTTNFDIINGGYRAVNDPRYTLTANANQYIYTQPDGTRITFEKKDSGDNASGLAREIRYPNGFTITISARNKSTGLRSVSTNNGLQLVYVYEDADNWSSMLFPKSIVAINNAESFCDISAGRCDLDDWPSVSYRWPSNMPHAKNFVFTVNDGWGRTTEYHHKAYSTDADNTAARLYKIVSAQDSTASIIYDYKNTWDGRLSEGILSRSYYIPYLKERRVLSQARSGNTTRSYSHQSDHTGYFSYSGSQGVGETVRVELNHRYSVPIQIFTNQSTITKDASYANTLDRIDYKEGGHSEFSYDDRLNLIERKDYPKSGSSLSVITQAARYPASCANPKTCNQPLWVQDGRGQRTHYQYHPESGQIAKVTYPSVNGIAAQTRYRYQPYYAWYKNAAGNIVKSATPIYRLAEESTCINGAASGDGCADPSDELITRYHYGQGSPSQANNLWLRGVEKVSAEGTLRTCYQYDRRGNRIAETAPNAALASCPQ